ncbi:MAG: hypothetical protein C4525_02795 [Desulfarculus sp.]|jgi:putative transposase|nr:MAG: hypothetical protein C4525_02795 [Desulfarculus sp.]
MDARGAYDYEGQAFPLTFSCFNRRRLLDDDAAKGIVVSVLTSQLSKHKGKCLGFVVMPDHVHALVWFSSANQISSFVKQWKRLTSFWIKKNLIEKQERYLQEMSINDPVWQRRYYSFNIYSDDKIQEKLNYMHNNPVKAGLVERPEEWQFSSARHFILGQPVGVEIGTPG